MLASCHHSHESACTLGSSQTLIVIMSAAHTKRSPCVWLRQPDEQAFAQRRREQQQEEQRRRRQAVRCPGASTFVIMCHRGC